MPDDPDPARLAELRRIARVAGRRVWGQVRGDRARYHHGLDLDDLESAAMEALLRALPRHDGRPDGSYLYRCALGGAQDAVRDADPLARTDRERRKAAGESTAVTDPIETLRASAWFDRSEAEAEARGQVEARDAARMVQDALATLSERDRALLLRIYRDGMQQAEVAAERGVSHTAVSQAHAAALRRLELALVAQNGRDVMQE